jgi:broad specificity phosphatase PhoE
MPTRSYVPGAGNRIPRPQRLQLNSFEAVFRLEWNIKCNLVCALRDTTLKERSLKIGKTAADRSSGIGEVLRATQERDSAGPEVELPVLYLARHGETAWSLTGQHTGLTDLPLTHRGQQSAIALGKRLRRLNFDRVFTSPLQRARRTCELAGFGAEAEVDPDLLEWNYGEYEGLTAEEIHAVRPDWQMFRDGCPGGESPHEVAARADRVLSRVRAIEANILLFSSAHFLRVLAARWLGLSAAGGKYLALTTASLSALGYEHNLSDPVIRLWNDVPDLNSLIAGSPISKASAGRRSKS